MVNYFNPLGMYHGKGGGGYGAGGAQAWYGAWGQAPQYDEQQPWHHPPAQLPAGEWAAAPAPPDWAPPEPFPKREPLEPLLPSPAEGRAASSELSSPGGPSPPARPPATRSPYEWMKKPNYQSQPNPGKTRTKDKYRVVYSDHQRLELEKEFHYSRYITIRRKAELAANLGLSERQVKIWFQNRRAKERKQVKKRDEIALKEKSDCPTHALQHPLHHATVLHHQQMAMQGMLPHHHPHHGYQPDHQALAHAHAHAHAHQHAHAHAHAPLL